MRTVPNPADERRRRLPVLPPGAVLLLTATRNEEGRAGRMRPHQRARLANVDGIRSALRREDRSRRMESRAALGLAAGGDWWSVDCAVQNVGAAGSVSEWPVDGERVSASCRLTAFLLSDWEDMVRTLRADELEGFRQYACRHPFDADVRRNLRIYLGLWIQHHKTGLSEPAARVLRQHGLEECRRMQDRLRGALRRLRRRMVEAVSRRAR